MFNSWNLNDSLHVQVAALLQNPQADPKPGGDVDAVQWKEVASLSAMQSTRCGPLAVLNA